MTKQVTKKGFTLIEILISVGIFAVLVTVALGSIASIFDANRKSQSLKAIITNLNFAVEVMAREIRFGENYHCGEDGDIEEPQNCSSGSDFISFLSAEGIQIAYTVEDSQLKKSEDGGETFLGVTAPDITIEHLKFFVLGAGQVLENEFLQPKVIILLRGYAGSKPTTQSTFILETSISQRVLDTE